MIAHFKLIALVLIVVGGLVVIAVAEHFCRWRARRRLDAEIEAWRKKRIALAAEAKRFARMIEASDEP